MESLLAKVIKIIKAVVQKVKQRGIKGLWTACNNYIRFGKAVINEYAEWIAVNEPKQKQLNKQKEYQSCQNIDFTIVLETEQEKSVQSIQNQTYSKWNIIHGNLDKVLNHTNSDYLIFLGKDIELAPFALYEIVKTIESRDGMVYYSDHDLKIEESREEPVFKPDFAIDTLLSKNYIGNMFVVKTKFLQQYPDILQDLNLQDRYYDLLLKMSEKTKDIIHISKVLYHELTKNKQIPMEAQKENIRNYLKRNGQEYKEIKDGMYKGNYKIEYKIKGNPKISLIVPNKDHIRDLEKLIQSVEKSTYQNYEIVIIENNSEKEDTFEYYEKIQKQNAKIRVETFNINYFNYSAIINFGVKKARGEYIILLNNDIEILTPDWIEQMLMYTQREEVGICGIKLYFPDRSIQHAGVTIGTRGLAGHRSREIKEQDFKENDFINIVQNLSAVTAACFMVKKKLYEEILGFDEKLAVAFNDIDFCLKVRKKDLLIVYNPFAYGYHYESKSRGEDTENEKKQKRFAQEYELFVKRWAEVISKGDPYYNQNYRLDVDIPKINYHNTQR